MMREEERDKQLILTYRKPYKVSLISGNMANLSEKLEQVKRIKRISGYLAGTVDALKYLKRQEKYQELLDEVLEDLGSEGYVPTLKEVANICEEGRIYAEWRMAAAINEGLEGKMIEEAPQTNIIEGINEPQIPEEFREDDDSRRWKFNYRGYLRNYVEGARTRKNSTLLERRQRGINLGRLTMEGAKMITDEEGRSMTFEEFKEHPELYEPGGDGMKLEDYCDAEELEERLGELRRDPAEEEGKLQRVLERFNGRSPADRLTEEEREFVYHVYDSYKRMELEKTINKNGNDKRLALGKVLDKYESDMRLTPEEAVEITLASLKSQRKRYEDDMKKMFRTGDYIPEIIKTNGERLLRLTNHQITAIARNKRWIIETLEGRIEEYSTPIIKTEDDEGEEWKNE